MEGTMEGPEAVQRATELIEQRLAEEEETEKLRRATPGKTSMDMLVLEDEKRLGVQSPALQKVKGQERVRKTSLDLRREIIDVGGIQNLIELRKKRKQKKRDALAAAQEPPPEPEEITGPVDEETFLKAAVEGKIKVIDKFLADGGSADTCDEFRRTALHRASLEGHMEILEKLLENGATVDFQDRLDCTAMHWACRGGHLEVVKLLQSRGANTDVRDKTADQQYMEGFKYELEAFKERVRGRAKLRIEKAMKEYEEEERKKRLGPGGLDPVEVYESLPEELQKCFDVKDVQMLQDAISKMDPTDAKYHMQRCIDSGLWVPNSKSGEAKEGEEAGPGDPLLEAVPKAGNEKDISA